MKENGIETTIKQLELILKARREHKEIIECVGGSCMNCDPDIKALVKSIDILSDYKRVLQENEYMHNELDKQQTKINKYAKENEELKKFHIQDNKHLDFIMENSITVQKVKDKIEKAILNCGQKPVINYKKYNWESQSKKLMSKLYEVANEN